VQGRIIYAGQIRPMRPGAPSYFFRMHDLPLLEVLLKALFYITGVIAHVHVLWRRRNQNGDLP
jgi:hypothetical protein